MILQNPSGKPIFLQAEGIVTPWTLDDNESNTLEDPAVLYVSEQSDVSVMFADGSIGSVPGFNNQYILLVKKVYATGSPAKSKIVLFKNA